jgi:hypothetical protein
MMIAATEGEKVEGAKYRRTIGRWVIVATDDGRYVGTVMDDMPRTHEPKRVRVQRGSRQGDVLMPGAYKLVGFLEETEVDP